MILYINVTSFVWLNNNDIYVDKEHIIQVLENKKKGRYFNTQRSISGLKNQKIYITTQKLKYFYFRMAKFECY